jgi:hypothetical protein
LDGGFTVAVAAAVVAVAVDVAVAVAVAVAVVVVGGGTVVDAATDAAVVASLFLLAVFTPHMRFSSM